MRKNRPIPAAANEIHELAADIRDLIADFRREGKVEIEFTTFLPEFSEPIKNTITLKLPKGETENAERS